MIKDFLTRIDKTQSLTEGQGGRDKREGNDFQVFSLGVIHEGPGRVSLGRAELGRGRNGGFCLDLVNGRGPLYMQEELSKGIWQSNLYTTVG